MGRAASIVTSGDVDRPLSLFVVVLAMAGAVCVAMYKVLLAEWVWHIPQCSVQRA
jgi:hypothetical protein